MSQLSLKTIKLGDSADTSKNFLIKTPAIADGTLTIEREDGTDVLTVAANGIITGGSGSTLVGNGPAFIAEYLSPIASSFVLNKLSVLVATKNDGNCWNGTTDRFQPTVAGYYLVTFQFKFISTSVTSIGAYIYLNGVSRAQGMSPGHLTNVGMANVQALIYMNGTTDYVEFYTEGSGTGSPAASNLIASAFLARAA